MRIAFFSSKKYDREFFDAANSQHDLVFHEPRLTEQTAALARGFPSICVFVNDIVDRETLQTLAADGLKIVALRCAGFNNVDLEAAKEFGIAVVRVPAYSPHAVAEHTVALMLALNRRLHKAYNRVREGDFRLDGLLGFDLHGRTVGVIGTGKIGECVCRIMSGFGCRVLGHDVAPNPACEKWGVDFVALPKLLEASDIVTLHCPLMPETHHLIDSDAIKSMKEGVMLINTSRGGIIDTRAVIGGLKSGKIGSLGVDVYEEEADLFFEDLSSQVILDDTFVRLLTFPNVLITGHQGFFTADALQQIAHVTLTNVDQVDQGQDCPNLLTR